MGLEDSSPASRRFLSKLLPYLLGHGSVINKVLIKSENLYSYYPSYVFKSTKFDHES